MFAFDVTNYRYTKIKIKSFLRGNKKIFFNKNQSLRNKTRFLEGVA
ncbi:hypothetical protein YPPY66_0106 [Yersinia pestis PY-66]|uniref:Uncharacterized protein n=2 Tax=Yersinia pestis TaxID=632 RepID=A0AAV3B166_YERPE|nr:hypothetical protein YPIP275_1080 [Yersinia pestis biovar Orientalis str. IP275]EDR41311.1 hypothetical protein YpE1979001_2048 [Yersinia pestis biovar Antiqua str. E1979001]EEO78745.1 hypothetical protein YPF_4831 [Yersinia pestis biovar Orientalis str. India 195]EIQ95997.1 hypothetical protein YPPY01_4685 [Yersinia pestis PY-01]EIQ96224.1 hypothetical protein YPPY02_4833 [Yersinia pestis PY-02]EIQ97364.1 hypothetical protein YPPY05_4715 [Yersinia pestis PY-05]EIR00091.1 hypothetical prot